METLFKPEDILLIKAFLIRESMDYKLTSSIWIADAYNQLEKECLKFPNMVLLRLDSLGNTGCLIRRLQLDTIGPGWKASHSQEIAITMCPCGKIDHLISQGKEI